MGSIVPASIEYNEDEFNIGDDYSWLINEITLNDEDEEDDDDDYE